MTNWKANKYAERYYEYYWVKPGESIKVAGSGHIGEKKLCD